MDLFKLMRLQEIDKRLMELESLKGDLPDQIEELSNRLSSLKENLSIDRQDLETVKKQSRTIEQDIQYLSEKLKKYQEQIYSVKTNKEYDAITAEIETLEKQLEERELKGVESLEKEDNLTAEIDLLAIQSSELEKRLDEKKYELQEKLIQTHTEQNKLKNERDELTLTVDRRFLATYERIRKGRDGIALAEVSNYTCNACNATIPAQTVVEIRKMDRIITCEVCGRILMSHNNQVEKSLAINADIIA